MEDPILRSRIWRMFEKLNFIYKCFVIDGKIGLLITDEVDLHKCKAGCKEFGIDIQVESVPFSLTVYYYKILINGTIEI